MARYEDQQIPRGASRRWEVVVGADERQHEAQHLRAVDVRAQHRVLQAMSEEDLEQIPLLPEGQRLARYKEHLDLHDPARANFLAEGTEVVSPGQRIIAKADVSREIWDGLIETCHEVVGWRRKRTA